MTGTVYSGKWDIVIAGKSGAATGPAMGRPGWLATREPVRISLLSPVKVRGDAASGGDLHLSGLRDALVVDLHRVGAGL